MFKSKFMVVLLLAFTFSNLLAAPSFTYTGPTSATVSFGNSTTAVTYYFSYSNLNGLVVPKLAIAVDGTYIAGFLCEGADPYLPSYYTFSLSPGTHTLTFVLQSLGSGIPDCASSANLWQTSTATVNVNFQISVENIFGGGSITVNSQSGLSSPQHKTVSEGNNVSIGAEEQDYGGYHWIWNSNGTNNSVWTAQSVYYGNSQYSSSQNTSYSVRSNDANTRVVAALRKIVNATFQNNGRSITANGSQGTSSVTVQVVEQNSVTVSTDNSFTDGGVGMTFDHWEKNGQSYSSPITITDNSTFTAKYNGKPIFNYLSTYLSSVVGQPVVVYWTDYANSGVTQYQIWRKVKHNNVWGNPTLLTTLGPGYQQYTDYDYVVASSYIDFLEYEVLAYYQPSGTWSDPFWVSTYGQIAPSITDNNNKNAFVSEGKPTEYSVTNYPNPFNPSTTISYQLPENGFVTIKVYDVLGKEVATLVNENKSAGYYTVNFDASSARGGLTSGVYIYTINVNNYVKSKKMLLVK